MKKKLALCILVLSLICVSTCMAQTVCEQPIILSDGYVSIKGSADAANQQLAYKAARTGDTLQYVAIKEVISGEDKSFEIKFRIPELINGESSNGIYNVYVTDLSKPVSFEYISFEGIYKKIKAAESKETLYTVIYGCTDDDMAALKAMGIDTDRLKNVSSKLRNITDGWYDICDFDMVDAKTAAVDFNKVMGLEYAKAEDTATALELINPIYNKVAFNAAENKTELTAVMESNLNTESLEKFNEAYVLSNKIIEFRNLRATQFVEAIENYNTYFGFSKSSRYSTYSHMPLTKQGKVGEKISQNIGGSDTIDDILDVFEAAVKEVAASGGSSGGSGGGGGSTGVYSSGLSDSKYEVEVKPEEIEHFSDLSEAEWAREAVEVLYNKGIVAGDGTGKFNPNDSVTREEFTKMVVLVCGIYDKNSECDFTDVKKNEWYYKYIASAVQKGIINGVGDGMFGTGSKITREDMAVITDRAANTIGKNYAAIKELSEFTDSYMISDYARESIEKLYCAGIINGVGGGAFAPTDNCTRAQAAKIIYEAFIK